MKFFNRFFVAVALLVFLGTNCYASETSYADKLSSIGLDKLFTMDDHSEITKLMDNMIKYASEHKLDKLDSLYASDYFNSDGFDRGVFMQMVKETWDAYPNITYTAQIRRISIDNDFALVEVFETAMGETKAQSDVLKEKGLLYSESTSIYCLKKIGRNWKIFSDYIIKEKDSLRFGEAKNLQMDISAPGLIAAKKDYTASLNMTIPRDTFILAAISNEPITYPTTEQNTIFKNIKQGGLLERVLTANSSNHNEFSIASVGITKAKITNQHNVDMQLSGIAFLRTRVNVIPNKNTPLSK